jgi:hypothetical protein
MKLWWAITVTLGVVLSSGHALARELDKLGCERRENTLTAEGVAYDAPGGGKIGYLSFETKYVAVTFLRHTDDHNWLLLTGPGGVHVGWIRANQVKRRHLGLICPIESFYPLPK